MKRNYIDLMNLNRDLINGYRIRCTNHEELTKNLRFLNQMVQKASNLRSKLFEISKIISLFCFFSSRKIPKNNDESMSYSD
jgi:hypothetical protein